MNDDLNQAPHEPQELPAADAFALAAPLPPPVPTGLRNIWRKWLNVTTRPSVASFARELPTANWYDTLMSLVGLGLLSAITSYFSKYSTAQILGYSHWNGEVAGVPIPRWAASMAYVILQPLVYFLVAVFLFIVAKWLGGKGSFLEQVYATALFYVPLLAVTEVVRYAPIVGNTASTILYIYGLVLLVLAIAASQRLTIGKSVFVAISPILAFIVAIIVVVILLLVIEFVGAMIGLLFSIPFR